MKKARKLLALILALTVALTMGIATTSTVFGANDKSITLSGGKAGHTYTLYQIFTGTVKTVNNKEQLTNIQWGSDASDAYKAAYDTAAAAAKVIADANDARATAQDLVAKHYLGTGTPNALTADGDVVFSNLAEGYYVIVDTNNNTTVTEGDYNSAYIVQVVKNVEGEIKGSGSSSDKKIKEKDGSVSQSDAAAYNIGDAVPFQLTATAADNVAAYKKYHITFQDKQSDGLDAPTSFKVTVLGKEFTLTSSGATPAYATTDKGTKITVTNATPDTGNTFAIKVEFEPTADGATYLDAECNSAVITVDYTATLNSSAEIGLPGNDNKSHITYSNNPESTDGHEEGKTPDDTTKVFTYKTVVDKVDADGKALEGAGFTIYQEVAEGTTGAVLGAEITFAEGVEHSAIASDKYYVAKAMTTVSGNNAQFAFEGLADGNYVIVETTIPTGFNAFESKAFTISSTVTEDGITELTGADPFTTTNPGANGTVTSGTHALDSGELYGKIENDSGAELPSTGGIGTTIFYILGALLVVGCGIVLIARRRMTAK